MHTSSVVIPAVPGIARHRVLIADSDVAFCAGAADVLRARGIAVVQASNGFELQSFVELSLWPGSSVSSFDLVVCEARLKGKTGLEVLADLKARSSMPPFVFTVARLDRFASQEARRLGALGILHKPIDVDGLRLFIQGVVL